MSSGDTECRPDLERRLFPEWCVLRAEPLPSARGLATSAIEVLADGSGWPLTSPLTSPLSSSAIRADRLTDARLVVREMVLRELGLIPLLEVLRAGFGFLPRPRPRPLCICRRINLYALSTVTVERAGQCSASAVMPRGRNEEETRGIGKKREEREDWRAQEGRRAANVYSGHGD